MLAENRLDANIRLLFSEPPLPIVRVLCPFFGKFPEKLSKTFSTTELAKSRCGRLPPPVVQFNRVAELDNSI
jgi:hypothetical protein